MFSLFNKKKPVTAIINDTPISVQPRETLLQAALRQGVAFPHSCRVGGCATCKCRLLEGRVKELTETGYVLSGEELDRGFILACQAVPQTPVRVEVDLSTAATRRRFKGRILAQTRLTTDITELRVQLDEGVAYRAGQYAEISVDTLPGVARAYSFATAPRPDGQVSFFVRHVPGGRFSGVIHAEDLRGQGLTLDGPLGEFWIRPAETPLLMIAGGSGLAPILAMLEALQQERSQRPVTLLFGARTQSDLYRLEALEALAKQALAPFRFLPILSAEPEGSTWSGARGLVTDFLPEVSLAGAHAYLCGPPAMIDRALPLLLAQGLSRDTIHADRFVTAHDAWREAG